MLLVNGIIFGIFEGVFMGERVVDNVFFIVYEDVVLVFNVCYKLVVEYLLFIDESVCGLIVGVLVEYCGIEIGNVIVINLFFVVEGNILECDYFIFVFINIYLGKVC